MKLILLLEKTAGHLLPGLSLGKKAREKKIEVKYIVIDGKITRKLQKEEDFIFVPEIKDFKSYKKCVSIIKKNANKEDVILTFGGRISLVFLSLFFKGYRNLYQYELNTIMGKSNKVIVPFCKKIFTYFPLGIRREKNMGHPLETKPLFAHKAPVKLKDILVLSGSNGSSEIYKLLDEVSKEMPDLKFDISVPFDTYDFKCKNVRKIGFIDRRKYGEYDLIIARSGAGTIADIISSQSPTLFLPSRHVKNDHQLKNAKFLKKTCGVPYLTYDQQNKNKLIEEINNLRNIEKREKIMDGYERFSKLEVSLKVLKEMGF